MNKYRKKINKKGIILIEALISLTVIVVVMTALVTALVSALSSTTFSNEQTQATAYAQEGIEIAREMKNSNFADFESLAATGTEQEFGESVFPSSGSDIDGKFSRWLVINMAGGTDCETGLFVSSIVKWSGSRCTSGDMCHKVVINSCFTNLNYFNP